MFDIIEGDLTFEIIAQRYSARDAGIKIWKEQPAWIKI